MGHVSIAAYGEIRAAWGSTREQGGITGFHGIVELSMVVVSMVRVKRRVP